MKPWAPSSRLHPWAVGLGARLALRLKPFERRPRSCRARLNLARRPFLRALPSTRRSPRIARKLLLEGGQPLGDRGFDLDEFFARPERFLAGAGANFRAVDGDLSKADQPLADQRGHALRQQSVEDLRLPDPEISEPVIIQRHAAGQPTIGGVALGEPFQSPRRTHPFNRRIKPQRKQNRRIGGRPARFALARENLIVKLRKIEALDKTPDDARAMLRRQKPLEIDHIPAQLTPIRPHHPSFRHRRFPPTSAMRESQRDRKRQFLHTLECGNPRAPSPCIWIPAFAGMTKGYRQSRTSTKRPAIAAAAAIAGDTRCVRPR